MPHRPILIADYPVDSALRAPPTPSGHLRVLWRHSESASADSFFNFISTSFERTQQPKGVRLKALRWKSVNIPLLSEGIEANPGLLKRNDGLITKMSKPGNNLNILIIKDTHDGPVSADIMILCRRNHNITHCSHLRSDWQQSINLNIG